MTLDSKIIAFSQLSIVKNFISLQSICVKQTKKRNKQEQLKTKKPKEHRI